jgi:hypothetical protein
MAAVLSSGLDPRIAAVAKKVVAEDERNRARVVGSVDSEKAPCRIRAQDVVIHKVVRRREKKDVETILHTAYRYIECQWVVGMSSENVLMNKDR